MHRIAARWCSPWKRRPLARRINRKPLDCSRGSAQNKQEALADGQEGMLALQEALERTVDAAGGLLERAEVAAAEAEEGEVNPRPCLGCSALLFFFRTRAILYRTQNYELGSLASLLSAFRALVSTRANGGINRFTPPCLCSSEKTAARRLETDISLPSTLSTSTRSPFGQLVVCSFLTTW